PAPPAVSSSPQGSSVRPYYIFTALCLVACIVSYFYFVRMPFAKYYIAAAKRPHKPVEDYSPTDDTALSMNSDPEDEKASLAGGHHHVSMWSVAKQIWPMGMSVWGVFMITFMIFPGVVPSGIPYRQTVKSWNIDNAWWVTFCFLIFNIFDTSGRTLAGYVGRLGGFKLLVCLHSVGSPCAHVCARWTDAIALVAASVAGRRADRRLCACCVHPHVLR
ncbi:MAG: hypothetical protein EOO65_04675, partial [Methanosarcinales archaeon]